VVSTTRSKEGDGSPGKSNEATYIWCRVWLAFLPAFLSSGRIPTCIPFKSVSVGKQSLIPTIEKIASAISGVRRKYSWGVIQWHVVVICIWYGMFVTSQFDVIFMFPSQRFGEVC